MHCITDVMTATFQLPYLTWNTPHCLKRKLNQWPQSNYISRPAGYPCVCVTPVCVSGVGIVSATRAFCHLPAGLIRVLQSYVALERSSTPQEAASTQQTPHSAVCSVSSTPRRPLKAAWSLCLWFLPVCCVGFFTSEETQLRSEVGQDRSDISSFFISIPEQDAETEWLRQTERRDCTECPQLHHYLLGCLCPHVELAHSASLL